LDMKSIFQKAGKYYSAFSLAEMVAALTIGTMVLVTVLGIYGRAETSADAIKRRLGDSRLPWEILQRIAEDLDKTTASGSNAQITIENKFEKGFCTAQMKILDTIYNSKNKKETFRQIIWQSSYDYDTDSLTIYRSYTGMDMEDKLLDERRKSWEKAYSFVPVCTGVTFFRIQVPQGQTFQNEWKSSSLPKGVTVIVSFAEPFKRLDGTLDVEDEQKIMRTIAIDRTRKINFIFTEKEDEQEQEQ